MKKPFLIFASLTILSGLLIWWLNTPFKYILQSKADLTSGKVARAVTHLEEAYKKYPNSPIVNFNLAKSYLSLDETEKATKLIKEKNLIKVLSKDTSFQDFLLELSEANKQSGNKDEAKVFAETYLNNTNKNETSKRLIKNLIRTGQILDNKSIEIWERAYNIASAIKDLELRESLRALLLPKYFQEVEELNSKKRFEEALQVLKKADVVGTNAEVHYLKAMIYSQTGQINLAEKYFEEAIQLQPDNDDYKISYANTLKRIASATKDQTKRKIYSEKIKLLLGDGRGDQRKISILNKVINLNAKYKITNANLKIIMIGDFLYPSLEFKIKPISNASLKKVKIVFLDQDKKQLDYYESAITQDEVDQILEVTSRNPVTSSNFVIAKVFLNDEIVKEYTNK